MTTEAKIRVFDPESGEEGYANIGRGAGGLHLFGPVVKLDRVFDSHGAEFADPTVTVIDRDPKFTT